MKRLKRLLLFYLIYCNIGYAQISVALNPAAGNYPSWGTGVNMGNHDYFSSYIRKSLLGNPSLQPVITNIMVQVATTGTLTTFKDFNPYSQITSNELQNGHYIFACTGGQFVAGNQVCTGANLGASGTISSNTAADGVSNGATFTISGSFSTAPQMNDTIFVFAPVQAMPLSQFTFNTFQWNHGASGTGSVAVDSNSADVPAGGVQCAQLNIGATGSPTSSANINTAFDTSGQLNYNFSGSYTQNIKAKILAGSGMSLVMTVVRSGGVNASNTIALSGSGYQQYSGTFVGTETGGTTAGNVQVEYELTGPAGSSICVYDATLNAASDTNPSLERNQVQTDLAAINAGETRFSWPVNGDSLVNMLAPEAVRAGSQGEGSAFNVPSLGLHDYLTAMADFNVGRVWINLPCTMTTTDAVNFVDYYAAAAGGSNVWANLRATLGQTAPWTGVFKRATIEYCNEPWNSAFGNMAFPQYTAGGNAAWNYVPLSIAFFAAMKADSNWNSAVMKTAAGIQTANSFFGGVIATADTGNAVDTFAVNEYGMFNVTNCTPQQEFQSATTEAYANVHATGSASGFYQSSQQGRQIEVYEYQNSTNSGSCTQAQITGLPEGGGYALPDLLMPLLANQQFGVTDQNFFVLYQFNTGISTSGGATTIADWGIKTGPGGAYNKMRPGGLGIGIANGCANLGTGYQAVPTSPPTLNYPGGNGINNITGVPLMQFLPFKNGTQRCIVVANTDFSSSHSFFFTGSEIPTGTVTVTLLSPSSTTISNEAPNTAPNVTTTTTTLTNPGTFPALSPFSVESVSWNTTATAGPTTAPMILSGQVF